MFTELLYKNIKVPRCRLWQKMVIVPTPQHVLAAVWARLQSRKNARRDYAVRNCNYSIENDDLYSYKIHITNPREK